MTNKHAIVTQKLTRLADAVMLPYRWPRLDGRYPAARPTIMAANEAPLSKKFRMTALRRRFFWTGVVIVETLKLLRRNLADTTAAVVQERLSRRSRLRPVAGCASQRSCCFDIAGL